MGLERRVALSPRNDDNSRWVPSCFGDFGCGDTAIANKTHSNMMTRKSAPFLILKGLGTMTLGRIGERKNILRDDITTWKQRIEDSLFIGWITYSARSSFSDNQQEQTINTKSFSNTVKNPALITIDDIEEISVYHVSSRVMEESNASQALLQLLNVLEGNDFSGGLRLVNDLLADHQRRLEDKSTSPSLEDTLTMAFVMHNKAVLEMVNGIFKYAVYYFKEAVEIKEALLGQKHHSVLETMEQLAIAMYGWRAYDLSHTVFRNIHARSSSPMLAPRIWNGIACLHYQKGELEFALQCAIRASSRHEKDEVAPKIALANKGFMQLAQGLKEGKITLMEADSQLSQWLGPGNEIVQCIRYNMHT